MLFLARYFRQVERPTVEGEYQFIQQFLKNWQSSRCSQNKVQTTLPIHGFWLFTLNFKETLFLSGNIELVLDIYGFEYSKSHLIWSLWDISKVNTLTKWFLFSNLHFIDHYKFDHNKRMITLTVITLSGFHYSNRLHANNSLAICIKSCSEPIS